MNTAVETTSGYAFGQSRNHPHHSSPNNAIPHRKPIPARAGDRSIQPLTPIQQRTPSHSHNRTSSSTALPPTSSPQLQYSSGANGNNMYQPNYSYPQQQQQQQQQPQPQPMTRRTLSNATTSTASTNGGRKNSVGGSTLQRSTSSRSGNSSTSYVASMRKQKATVWSDRAQHEDPRLVAKQREAKMKAALDLSSAPHLNSSRMSTSGNSSLAGGMRAKMRHHGAPKARQYNPTPNAASGVPMRLSAREVDDNESEDDHLAPKPLHQRSGSGRSSVGSQGRASSIYGPGGPGVMTRGSSESNTPPQTRGTVVAGEQQRQRATTQDSTGTDPTPVPSDFQRADYFAQRGSTKNTTPGSNVAEQENEFGKVGTLPHRVRDIKEEDDKNDDLHRRGSVDERSTTMRGYGKLFVANPDLSD